MRLCDITHFYATKSGGVKTYLLNKVNYVNNTPNYDIDHFLILPSNSNKIEVKGKSHFFFIKSPEVPLLKPYRGIIDGKKVKEIIKSEKPDIVEIGSPYMIPKWIKSLKYKVGYKISGFYHADIERTWLSVAKTKFELELIKNLAQNYIKRTYFDMDLVITPSKYIEHYLNNLGIYRTKTIYLGINNDIFSTNKIDKEFREKYHIEKHKIILLYVGRFSSEKRIFKLIGLFNKLDGYRPNKYHLLLLGGGPEEKKLKDMSSNKITILPYCSDKEKLASIYNSSDIFVTASNSETFGLTLLEAQSCGLPVVAFRTASIPEIVFNTNYLASSDEEFVRNIEIVANSLTMELKGKIRNFAIKAFSWEKTFNNLFEVYQELCGKPSDNSEYKIEANYKYSLINTFEAYWLI